MIVEWCNTLRPTRLLCMFIAEMMWGFFQCGTAAAELECPPSKSLWSEMRKRVAAALRFTRFRGASVNDLANCLALISLFDGCIKVKMSIHNPEMCCNYYHIWCHHHNLPTWIARLGGGAGTSRRHTASKSPKNTIVQQHGWVQPKWAHTPKLVLWFLIKSYVK